MRVALLLSLALCVFVPDRSASAQSWGRVAGTIIDASTGEALPGATVLVSGTNFGTATDVDGRYSLRLPVGRHPLRFTSIGFEPRVDTVAVAEDAVTTFDAALRPGVFELDDVTVEGRAAGASEAGVVEIDPGDVQRMPAPFKDGFRILKMMPGVATNNELSNEYSVRGGGYNENLVFINGFEVYKPFRVRQGEQEGLGIVNPDLAAAMTLYTGGFPARYGGKLSSALDVQYDRPAASRASASGYASLLDAGATASGATPDGRVGLAVGARKARARRFFGTQELKGRYDPDYTDVQGILGVRLADGHDLEVLGSFARHEFRFEPSTRKTFFGTFQNLQSLWVNYSGQEHDGYDTRFAGVRLSDTLSPRFRMEHRLSLFETEEREQFDVRGAAILYIVDNPFESDPDTGEGLIPIGASRQEDVADNRVEVRTLTGQGRYLYNADRHAAEIGWTARRLRFEDRLFETSTVEGRSREGELVRVVVDSLGDFATFDARQLAGYVQDAVDLLPERDRLVVTAGLRGDYFSFNDEFTLSPRLSARFRLDPLTSLTAAWGLYNQAPTYRELRGVPEPGAGILGAINPDLRAQRSVQYVAGVERFVPKRRMYVRAEAYFKDLSRIISYEVQNVRLEYSAENDARGFVGGLDVQLRGELVPGLESWINYGFMVARERFETEFLTRYNEGSLARPTDQRHTISVFVQDYVPGDPSWKLSVRMLYGSGLPYTPPVPGPRVGNVEIQVPGPRMAGRFPSYKRFDMGATKILKLFDRGPGGEPVELHLTGEILNVFDMTNTVAYTWIVGPNGIWSRIPTRLTPRTYNLRLRVQL